jgi:antitoxin CptB
VDETAEVRRKRLLMRSWRRGTREMDLMLGPFAEARLPGMDGPALDGFDRLLETPDQDLTDWFLGRAAPPDWARALVAEIARHSQQRPGRV